MTAQAVPETWRPAIRRENGHYRLAFRGREISGNAARLLGIPGG